MKPLTCKELVELVSDYLEDMLTPEERARFETHVMGCEGCSIYLEQMRQTIALMGKLTENDVQDPARQKLLETFRSWKGEEKG